MINIVIATTKSWNIKNARDFMRANKLKYKITLISDPKKLTLPFLKKLNPKYIFFPHWSWIIPNEIHETFTCIVFHMTDLPFGRGGSPLQNLISRGVYKTKVSALKVDGGLDTGPIYLKKSLSIKEGTAEDILSSISSVVFGSMIPSLLEKNIAPVKQKGKITSFKRRKPDQSNFQETEINSLTSAYDFIRMLDGEGYPTAFVSLKNEFRITFKKATLSKDKVEGQFTITKEKHE